MRIERTTIGSFPRSDKPLEVAIKDVIDLQLRHGIDVISDGEQRADMITYFEQIPGLSRGRGGLRISGKIKPMDDEEDFFKIKDYDVVKAHLESLNRRDVKIKITLTGPVTLGMTSAIGGISYYSNVKDPSIYNDCADALTPIARTALELGALLQIDEPGISARFESPKYLEKLLSSLPDSAIDDGKVSIHVCGSVKQVYDELLDLSVNIFSFGFSRAQESRNIEAISRASLEGDKKLGVGFISNTYLEEVDAASRRLGSIAEIVGVDHIAYIHPDCGFAPTPPRLVEPILRNMKEASEVFFHSLE
jgi:5-methyltetrahydropteroyltriglutamate--homocysteine methyltransferase